MVSCRWTWEPGCSSPPEPTHQMPLLLITDTSVLLNLIASGHAASIFTRSPWRFVVCPNVQEEALFLRNRASQESKRIDLAPFFGASQLECMAPESDEDFEWLLDFTAAFGRGSEGEAMCFALAASRKLCLAIDDRRAIKKASRLEFDQIIVSTPEIIRAWQETAPVDPADLAQALQAIWDWARYKPPEDHPLASWWSKAAAAPENF
jgi:hypothetical protein